MTAGGTHEPIDPVRYIGNHSSGKTGFAIAEEAARRGARVFLVTGPSQLPDPFGCEVVRVQTALQMRAAVLARADAADAIVMSAAVADFRPATAAADKIKKTDAPAAIELERNPDILAELGARGGSAVLVGFAAETSDVEANAKAKLAAKGCDLIVANDVSDPALGFGTDDNSVVFVSADGVEPLGVLPKRAIARAIVDRVADVARGPARRVTGSQLYIHSGTAFLAAVALGVLLVIHGWLTGAACRTILSRLFGVFYAAWVISMTLLPIELGPPGSGVGLDPYWRNSINLVPLKTIQLYLGSDLGRIAWANLLGNLLLLVPLGALGPVAWRKLDGWKRILAAGLAISLAIEGLQFAKWFVDVLGQTRSVDIDDIILNVAGALLGYALYGFSVLCGGAFARRTRTAGSATPSCGDGVDLRCSEAA